jgi:hypothetical protein
MSRAAVHDIPREQLVVIPKLATLKKTTDTIYKTLTKGDALQKKLSKEKKRVEQHMIVKKYIDTFAMSTLKFTKILKDVIEKVHQLHHNGLYESGTYFIDPSVPLSVKPIANGGISIEFTLYQRMFDVEGDSALISTLLVNVSKHGKIANMSIFAPIYFEYEGSVNPDFDHRIRSTNSRRFATLWVKNAYVLVNKKTNESLISSEVWNNQQYPQSGYHRAPLQ